jgi:hypothetical protein
MFNNLHKNNFLFLVRDKNTTTQKRHMICALTKKSKLKTNQKKVPHTDEISPKHIKRYQVKKA